MGFSRQEHWSGLSFPSPKETIERKKVKSLSRVWLFVTPWTISYQAPPSMEFSKQEYWSGLPFLSPTVLYLYQSIGYRLLQEGNIYDLEQCTSLQWKTVSWNDLQMSIIFGVGIPNRWSESFLKAIQAGNHITHYNGAVPHGLLFYCLFRN